MRQIPIFGDGIQSYSAVATSQRRLNCFYDPRPDQDKNAVIIRGTPGSVLWITLPIALIRGWHVMAGVLYVVSGAALYSVTTGGTGKGLAVSTGGVVGVGVGVPVGEGGVGTVDKVGVVVGDVGEGVGETVPGVAHAGYSLIVHEVGQP